MFLSYNLSSLFNLNTRVRILLIFPSTTAHFSSFKIADIALLV
ncbi:MAG: hypothetical protein CM15mP40_05190 [Alphaproteobacteria bacterium]|nr:MAG: hypothetical protein CM15mP40_05190 [Alphaproteobacteria bacterium]